MSRPEDATTRTKTASLTPKTTTSPSPAHLQSTDTHLGLLFEHFGYNPRAYIESFIYKASDVLNQRGEELETNLLLHLPDQEDRVAQSVYSILTLLDKALDHISDILELYSMQHVFGITLKQARYFVMPHQSGLELRNTRASEETRLLIEREERLKKRFNQLKATNHALTLALDASKRRRIRTNAVHSALIQAIGFAIHPQSDLTSTSTSLTRSVAQISPLRSNLLTTLSSLRQKDPLGLPLVHSTSKLSTTPSDSDPSPSPWNQGREGYLRWQTQRYLGSGNSGGKRRRDDDHESEERKKVVTKQVGKTADMDTLARLLQ